MSDEPIEIKFRPSFTIGEIVYDITNGNKGIVLQYLIDKRDVMYKVKWSNGAVSYTHLRAHETVLDLVCRLLLEKKKTAT